MELEARLKDLEFKYIYHKETIWNLTRRFCNLENFVCSHLGPVPTSGNGGPPGQLQAPFPFFEALNPSDSANPASTFCSSFPEREIPESQDLYSLLVQQISKLETEAKQFSEGDASGSGTSSSMSQHGPSEVDHPYQQRQPNGAIHPSRQQQAPHPYQLHHPPENNVRYQSDTESVDSRNSKKSHINIKSRSNSVISSLKPAQPTTSAGMKINKNIRENKLQTEMVQSGILPNLMNLSFNSGHQQHVQEKSQSTQQQKSDSVIDKPPTTTSKTRRAKRPKKCQKLCGNKIGHPCGHKHNPQSKCPPCSHAFPNVKIKCGHSITVACHLMSKIEETVCKDCTSTMPRKQLKKATNISNQKPTSRTSNIKTTNLSFSNPDTQFPAQTKFTFETQLSDYESAVLKSRDIIERMSLRNVDQLADELIQLFSQHINLIPKSATSIFQRAVIDSENPMSALDYTKLITKVKNDKNPLIRGFLDKLVELTMSLFSTLFPDCNPDSKSTVASSFNPGNSIFLNKAENLDPLSHKNHVLRVLRFIGTLFMVNVVNASDMKSFAERLLARTNETHLDYLCKMLNFAGQKLHEDILNIDSKLSSTDIASSADIPSVVWLKGLYQELTTHSLRADISTTVKNDIQRVALRQENRWKELDVGKGATIYLI